MTGDLPAAAQRAAGREVTAYCRMTVRDEARLELAGEDEPVLWPAAEVAGQSGVAVRDLPGTWLLVTVRETPEEGRALSGFRVAGGREVTVRCLLLFGDQAELVLEGGDAGDPARWPAAAIAAETGLEPGELPGRRFRVRVAEPGGRLEFSGFRVAG